MVANENQKSPGSVSGRIADYSLSSAIFVGIYKRSSEDTKRVSVYIMIDEAEKWNAPNPKFTASGGHSQELIHHLRHIFYKHQKEGEKVITFNDETKNKLKLCVLLSGDVLVGVENQECEYGVVVSFPESHSLFADLVLLKEWIDTENKLYPPNNPILNRKVEDHLKLVHLFP